MTLPDVLLPPGTVALVLRPFSGGKTESHALLQSIAAQFAEDADLTLAYGVHGKPFFPQLPDLHFNISHSGGIWACAFSRTAVGLDAQRQEERPWAAISARYFHPLEQQYVQQRGAEAFFDVWSARESYLKYLGCGLTVPTRSISTVAADGSFPALPDAVLTRLPDLPGYSLFLCTEKQPEKILWLS